MKTGFYPMKVRLKLFFDWGITFEEPYIVSENGNRIVRYANKQEIINGILESYPIEFEDEKAPLPSEAKLKEQDKPASIRTAPSSDKPPVEPLPEPFDEPPKGIRFSPKNKTDSEVNDA